MHKEASTKNTCALRTKIYIKNVQQNRIWLLKIHKWKSYRLKWDVYLQMVNKT